MSTTTHAGTVQIIFGFSEPISQDIDAARDTRYDEMYDLDAIAAWYQDKLQALLPQGWTINGDEIYRDLNSDDITNLDQLRKGAGSIRIDWARHAR